MKKIITLSICLLSLAACNKKDSQDDVTNWKIGGTRYEGGVNTMRTDDALYIKSPTSSSFLYARFAGGTTVTDGDYRVVQGIPGAPNEISFSVNRDGEDYISSGSGNPTVTVLVRKDNKLSIMINNVWMLHLPALRDSLLLDAVMIEQ